MGSEHIHCHQNESALTCASGEDYVNQLGDELFQGDAERAGQRILRDFRNMAFGRVALELPERLW